MRSITSKDVLEREVMDRNWPAFIEQAIGRSPTNLLTPDEVVAVFKALPRNWRALGPDLLYWFWRNQRPGSEVLRRVLLDTWRLADFPTIGCPAREWRTMFRITGFLSDSGDVVAPQRRRALYRACTPEGRRGMSWTPYRWKAEYFADLWVKQNQSFKPGHLYRTVAHPRDVLAINWGKKKKMRVPGGTWAEVRLHTAPYSGTTDCEYVADNDYLTDLSEFEFIIDARRLPITLVETAKARLARNGRDERREQARYESLDARER